MGFVVAVVEVAEALGGAEFEGFGARAEEEGEFLDAQVDGSVPVAVGILVAVVGLPFDPDGGGEVGCCGAGC